METKHGEFVHILTTQTGSSDHFRGANFFMGYVTVAAHRGHAALNKLYAATLFSGS